MDGIRNQHGADIFVVRIVEHIDYLAVTLQGVSGILPLDNLKAHIR